MAERGLRSQVEGWGRNHLQREGQALVEHGEDSQSVGTLPGLAPAKQGREKEEGLWSDCEMEGRLSLIKIWGPEPVNS